MSFFEILFLLLTESLARESQVSYAWNSTADRPDYSVTCGGSWHDGTWHCKDVHILLKQGLKIGVRGIVSKLFFAEEENHTQAPRWASNHDHST